MSRGPRLSCQAQCEPTESIMSLQRFATVALLTLLPALSLGQASCYGEADACRDFCEMAANCLDCGGNISLDQCKNECLSLSINQKKALANCAKDCLNIYACEQMVGFRPPNPCVY